MALWSFQDDSVEIVVVQGREVGIVRWSSDEIYALRNVCPHMGGPVCRGRLSRRLVADRPGELELDSTPVIACAWHHWEFDVRTGESLPERSRRERIRTFPVRVKDGRVLVDVGRRRGVAEAR